MLERSWVVKTRYFWRLRKNLLKREQVALPPSIGSKPPAFLMPETHHSKRVEADEIAWGSKFLLPIVDLRFC